MVLDDKKGVMKTPNGLKMYQNKKMGVMKAKNGLNGYRKDGTCVMNAKVRFKMVWE